MDGATTLIIVIIVLYYSGATTTLIIVIYSLQGKARQGEQIEGTFGQQPARTISFSLRT